jgi:hypothetical protein
MSRFLSFLDIKEPVKSKLPQDILDGGKLIDGLQMIYEEMPSGAKKDNFAVVIAETASILMKAINELNINGLPKETVQKELKAVQQAPSIPTPIMPETQLPESNIPEPELPNEGEIDEQKKFLKHILTEINNIEF